LPCRLLLDLDIFEVGLVVRAGVEADDFHDAGCRGGGAKMQGKDSEDSPAKAQRRQVRKRKFLPKLLRLNGYAGDIPNSSAVALLSAKK
jgi:hypothetical protein